MADDHDGALGGPHRSSAALWERVETQGRDIRNLAEETASQFRDFRSETSNAIGGVMTSVDKLGAKLEAAATSAAERQRPQYLGLFGAMIAAVGLSITITQTLTGLHDKPVDDKLSNLSTAISDLNKNTATQIGELVKNTTASFGEAARTTVSQREFSQTVDFQHQLFDVRAQQRDQQAAASAARIDKVESAVVPRTELDFHWRADDKRMSAIEAHQDNLDHRLDTLVSPADTIKSLQQHEHELELKVYGAH